MAGFSRRQLAHYAVGRLLAKDEPAKISLHLAAALIENKMQAQAELLLDDIAQELEARGLLATATLTAANSLSASLKKSLSTQIKKTAKVDTVVINEKIDPSVIGGFKIETMTKTWDKTIARKLAEIKGGL